MLESDFAQVAAILVLAAVLGSLARLLRQPVLVAYIIVGIVVGPAALNLVTAADQIALLAKVGIAILLFLVGLKLDVHLIRSTGKVALLTGVGQVVFTSVIGFGIVLLLGFDPIAAVYIAVALTFSSTIIIVKLLSDKRELDQLHGRIAVGFLIVQDLLVIVAMILIVALGTPSDRPVLGQVALTFVGGVVFLLAVALIARYVLPRILDWLARSQELTLLFGVAWAMALAAVSSGLGLSMEIGAFVAGVALASTPYRESIGARLISLRDILILFFFIELGAALTFSDAVQQLVPAILLSAFVLVGNPLIVMAIMGVMGYRKKVSFQAGLAVAQISEFSLILIALGFSLGQVDEQVLGLVTLVGIITITLSTYLILYSDQVYVRLAPYLSVFERRSGPYLGESVEERRPIDAIVIGAGRMGTAVIEGLHGRGLSLLVVDFDPQALRRVATETIETLYGDAAEPDFTAALPVNETRMVVCAVPDRETNLTVLETLRRSGFDGDVFLTAMDDATAALFAVEPGVRVIRPLQMAAASVVDGISRALDREGDQEP
jgi:Kef-type K+ transport system membrane component KefB